MKTWKKFSRKLSPIVQNTSRIYRAKRRKRKPVEFGRTKFDFYELHLILPSNFKSAKSSTAEKDIEDVDVQIELDDSLTPTCEEASTKEEEMPPNAADQLPETQDDDEKMEFDGPVQDKSSSEPVIVKDEPKEDFSAVVPNKGSNSNSSTKTVQSATTNNSQPNLEDEEECKNFLRRGWSQFLDQNRGKPVKLF